MHQYQGPVEDPVVRALAKAALTIKPDDATAETVTRSLVDAVGVVFAGGTHPIAADLLARRGEWSDAFGTRARAGASVWGKEGRAPIEAAALINGVRLRCFDYNDLYFGPQRGVHPSDVIPVIAAVAEDRGVSGAAFIEALQVAFKIQAMLCDRFSSASQASDYTTITALGAVAGLGRLISMEEVRLQHAFSIVVTMGIPPSEMESGARNRHGLLTGWKRFNAAWAGLKAWQAVALATLGVEGPYHSMVGKRAGLLKTLGYASEDVQELLAHLERVDLWETPIVNLKRWPLGSRGQSAIEATLAASKRAHSEGRQPKRVDVLVPQGVYDHMVRFDGYRPVSMDGADHSVPVAVAVALIDGHVDTRSFMPESYERPAVQHLLREVVFVAPSASMNASEGPNFGASVEITWDDGQVTREVRAEMSGGAGSPLDLAQIEEKFRVLVSLGGGSDEWAEQSLARLWAVADSADLSGAFAYDA